MIGRRVKISLDNYDTEWKDCYIWLRVRGYNELMDFEKEMHNLSRKDLKLSRRLRQVTSQIEKDITFGMEINEEVEKKEDKLANDQRKISEEIVKAHQKFLKERFIEGVIYDYEQKIKRPMTAEDILSFDVSILQDITELATGKIPKKV